MGTLEAVMALVLGILVMFFTPALVWATVIAGLFVLLNETIQDRLRESRPARTTRQRAQPKITLWPIKRS